MHHCVSRIKSHITKYHKSPSVCQHHCLQYTRTAPFCTTPAQNHDFLKPLEPKNHKTETVPQLLNNVFSDHRTLDMPETTNWSSDPMSSMIFFSTVLPKKRTEPKSVFFFLIWRFLSSLTSSWSQIPKVKMWKSRLQFDLAFYKDLSNISAGIRRSYWILRDIYRIL